MVTYNQMAIRPTSEKTILCHIEPSERLVLFTLHSGSVYKRVTDYFVINIEEDGTALTQGSSASLNSGEFYYDPSSSTLYIRTTDDSDPKTKQINCRCCKGLQIGT